MAPSLLILFLYSLSGLAVLLWATWARGFARTLSPPLDATQRGVALGRVKQAAFLTTVAQAMLLFLQLLASHHQRANWIAEPLGFYALTLIAQSQIRFYLVNRIRDLRLSQWDGLRQTVRVLTGFLALYGIYLVSAVLCATALHYISRYAGLPEEGTPVYTWFSTPFSVFFGVVVIAWASPLMVRWMFSCSPVTDPRVRQTLERCFARTQLTVPAFWMMHTDRMKSHNAMVTGLSMGRGIFRRSLFFTASLVDQLQPDEFEAVLLHEISHLALHHIRKRVLFGVLAFGISFVFFLLVVFLMALLAPPEFSLAGTLLGYAAMLLIQIVVLRWQVRRQELEADAYGVMRLGGNYDSFARALRKLTQMNDASGERKDPSSFFNPAGAHPATEQRLELLRETVSFQARPASAGRRGLLWAAAGSVAVLLAYVALHWVLPWQQLERAVRRDDLTAVERWATPNRVNAVALNGSGATIFEMAAGHGKPELVRLLVEKHGAKVNASGWLAVSPLMHAIEGGNLEIARYLIDQGADVNYQGYRGLTALLLAAHRNRREVVQLLLEKGANVNTRDAHHSSPLGVAAQMGYLEITELLLQHHPDLDARDDDGDTPLGMAVSFEHAELARRLEAAGARNRGRQVSGK